MAGDAAIYGLLTAAFAPARARAPRALAGPRRLLVLKPCCFGDVVMASAAIAALNRAYPAARITLAVGAWSRPAVAANPRLAALIDTGAVGTAPWRQLARPYLALARRLRAGHFDAALVLDRSPLLALLPWLARIPVRAGLDSAGRGFALTHRVPCPPGLARHEVAWYLDVVRVLGAPADPATRTEFYAPPAAQAAAAVALAAALPGWDPGRERLVALHTGGGSNPGMHLPAKRWAPAGWAAVLVRLLAAEPAARVLLVGGPEPADRAAAAAIRAALPPAVAARVVDRAGTYSWEVLGAILARCRLFLGPDTGALHLAVAAGTPAVAVFGPSDPRRYAPWDPGGRSRTVGGTFAGGDLAAQAVALAGTAFHESVSVDAVWAAVQAALRD